MGVDPRDAESDAMTGSPRTPFTTLLGGLARALSLTFGRRLWLAYVYGLLTAVLGMTVSIAVFTIVAIGVPLIIVWVGLPIVLAALLLARAALNVDLGLQRWLSLTEVQSVALDLSGLGVVERLRVVLRDRVTWSALVWSLLRFPVALGWLVLLVFYPLVPLVFVVAPFVNLLDIGGIDSEVVRIGGIDVAIPLALGGVLLLIAGAWFVRGVAAATAGFGVVAAGARQQDLQADMQRLRHQRDRSLANADYARQRIERDLHDGAQRHLTAAAMALGRARRKMGEDDPAVDLVDEATRHVNDGLEDMRRIVRRSGPASLDGRNLAAALRELAAGVDTPLIVECEVDDVPPNVRSAVYFVASEAVTNATRHARASSVAIRVALTTHGWLEVTITDDGVGGAREHVGGGIQGLRDRVDALGGALTVESPLGGPTTLRVSLPCES